MSTEPRSPTHSWILALRVIVVASFLLGATRATFFTVYRVSGSSMLTSLVDGDRIFVYDPPFSEVAPEVGQAVVLEVDGEILVKRILGSPGDTVELVHGNVVRNGFPVPESIGVDRRSLDWMPPTELGSNEYFVLGDHRKVSIDSRDFGPVGREHLLGVVMLRMPAAGGWTPVSGTVVKARQP